MTKPNAYLLSGICCLIALGSASVGQPAPSQTAPSARPDSAVPNIPGGQKYCQDTTFSTTSTSFVLVPNAVTINNTSNVTKTALLRWTGVAAHFSVGGWINITPAKDGIALPIRGQWFLGYDLDGDGIVSDTFGIQWPVSVSPGVHTLQPAMNSSDGAFRNIDGYCFSVELNSN